MNEKYSGSAMFPSILFPPSGLGLSRTINSIPFSDAASIDNLNVFHAGTRKNGGIKNSGGRVLGVTGVADSLQGAIDLAYKGVSKIKFDDMYYRKDIGWKGIRDCR